MPYRNFLSQKLNIGLPLWTVLCPVIACIILLNKRFVPENGYGSLIFGVALIAAVLAAVHHAEVIAHKVGEPFGTLILALAITVIEVSLIMSIMLAETKTGPSALARDTIFSAVMIIITGIIGLCLLIGGVRFKEQVFVKQGVNAALVTLITICFLTMVLPNYTTSEAFGQYSNAQLVFVAIVTVVLYLGFIGVQTLRHRDYFLPENIKIAPVETDVITEDHDEEMEPHAAPPNTITTISSLILLFLALVAVVMLSKSLSPAIEKWIFDIGAPKSLLGVIIAAVILLPEGMAAVKAVRKNRLQTSLNLALGSALASIGLTIPAVAILCVFTGMEITLGIDIKSMLLLMLSLFIISISFNTNKTNIQQGIVLLVLFSTYLFTTIVP